MSLTVNQWLAGFDSQTRSQIFVNHIRQLEPEVVERKHMMIHHMKAIIMFSYGVVFKLVTSFYWY